MGKRREITTSSSSSVLCFKRVKGLFDSFVSLESDRTLPVDLCVTLWLVLVVYFLCAALQLNQR